MNICIYGASSNKLAQEYYDAAEALGALMAQQGHTLPATQLALLDGGQSHQRHHSDHQRDLHQL